MTAQTKSVDKGGHIQTRGQQEQGQALQVTLGQQKWEGSTTNKGRPLSLFEQSSGGKHKHIWVGFG